MATKKIILCDTNIFIDYFHEDDHVSKELDYLAFDRLAMSVISVAESYFGMRKRERTKTRELVRKFNLCHVDKEISRLFIQYMLGYHDHGISIPDALIAATAVSNKMELFTHNREDFDFIEGLTLYNPRY